MKRSIFFVLVALIIQGCAANTPTLTREEWLSVTSRTYVDVTKDEALASAQTLLELADGDDFDIFHTQDGLYASRNWFVYMIISAVSGIDYWRIDAEEVSEGVRVSVQVNTQMQALVPMATTSGDWTATSAPMAGSPVNGTAIYDVFWSRMDYLLGQSEEWMDCELANRRVSDGLAWGTNEALCNSFNVNDEKPPELREAVDPTDRKWQ